MVRSMEKYYICISCVESSGDFTLTILIKYASYSKWHTTEIPIFKTKLHWKKKTTVTASNTTRRNWVTTYFPNKLDDPLLTKALPFQAGNKLNLLYGLKSQYTSYFLWFIQLIWAIIRWNQIQEEICMQTQVCINNAGIRHSKLCVHRGHTKIFVHKHI